MRDIFKISNICIALLLFYPFVLGLFPFDLSISLYFVFPTLTLIFLWYQTVRREHFQWKIQRFSPLSLIFGTFLVLALPGVFHTVYRFDSLTMWFVMLDGFLLYLVIGNYQLKTLYESEFDVVFPQKEFRLSLPTMLFVYGLLQSILGLYQFSFGFEQSLKTFMDNPITTDPRIYSGIRHAFITKRIIGTFGNPNLYGTVLAMVFPFGLLYLISQTDQLKKMASGIGLGLMLSALLLSGSRGAVLAWIIGILVFLFFSGKNNQKQVIYWLALSITAGLVIWQGSLYLTNHDAVQTISSRMKTGESTIRERYAYWSIATQMITNSPVLGNGLGSFAILYGKYKPIGVGESKYVHNTFLQMWSEAGLSALLGLVTLFCIFIIFPLSRYRRLKRDDVKLQWAAFYAGTLAFFLDSFISFGFYWTDIYLLGAIMMGGLYAACQAEFVPNPSPSDILWRRQPNTRFLVIAPTLIVFILLYTYYWTFPRFQSELKYQQGRLMLMVHNPDQAELLFQKAVYWMPIKSDYRQHLGRTLLQNGKVPEGMAQMQKAVALNPCTPYLHADLAESYLEKNNFAGAELELKKAIECYPGKPLYHQQLADFYRMTGNVPNQTLEESVIKNLSQPVK